MRTYLFVLALFCIGVSPAVADTTCSIAGSQYIFTTTVQFYNIIIEYGGYSGNSSSANLTFAAASPIIRKVSVRNSTAINNSYASLYL